MLQDDYVTYEQALEDLNLESLSDRRSSLCLKFAKRSVKHDKAKELFPFNLDPRNTDVYKVQFARTSRLRDSSIPQLQRALNLDARK